MRKPKLNAKILADPELLGNAIDKLLLRDPRWARASTRVQTRTRKVRLVVSEEAWLAYLHLDEAVNR